MNWLAYIFLLNVASTWFMVGLIWMVQIVHYPLFNDVGQSEFLSYHHKHQQKITLIVGPVMLVELITSCLLVWYPFQGFHAVQAIVSLGVLILIWISTATIQIPCHSRLAKKFQKSAYDRLVHSNWIRTIGWSVRGAILFYVLVQLID